MVDRFSSEYSTDRGVKGFVVDMSPSTLLEENVNKGLRTTMPVGGVPDGHFQTVGNLGLDDTLAARKLGATGRK